MDQEQSSTKSEQNTDQEQKEKSEQQSSDQKQTEQKTADQGQEKQTEQKTADQGQEKQTEQKTADQGQEKQTEQQKGEPKEADISLERVLELLKQANLINMDAPLRSLFKQGKIVTPTEWGLLMASGHWLLLWRRKGL